MATVLADAVADHAAEADALLRGVPGVLALADRPALDRWPSKPGSTSSTRFVDAQRGPRRAGRTPAGRAADIEATNAALVRAKDVLWALRHDRLRTAAAASAIWPVVTAAPAALAGFFVVQLALSAIDRLEVRGGTRPACTCSSGTTACDLDDAELAARLAARGEDPLYPSGAVRVADGALSFVYKAAAEIGELGDNTAALRAAIRADGLLHLALAAPARRWPCSVTPAGPASASSPSPTPTRSTARRTRRRHRRSLRRGRPQRRRRQPRRPAGPAGLRIPAPITTDAKVIPALVSREAARRA